MVGDVKQSIYRFRMARPELFMEKYNTYTSDDSAHQRIDLHKNFRSRNEVLDFTNDIFYKIMAADLGNVQYDDDAALYPVQAIRMRRCVLSFCLLTTRMRICLKL
ncbi:MAG: UvrD-helicase domain-containing protein [Agathobacter rectalis]